MIQGIPVLCGGWISVILPLLGEINSCAGVDKYA